MARIQLLLVDDDIDFAESLADMLDVRGYGVTLAHSGQKALKLAEDREFDMVLMDMKMPGMNGIECMTALRKFRPGISVVMITAFTQNEFIRQAMDSGALAVLSKPISPETLLKTIPPLPERSSILIVEDDEDLATELSGILEAEGYAVTTVPTMAAAKEVLAGNGVDLLVLDYRLPDGTGADLIAWLGAQRRSQDTVVITGYPEEVLARMPYISIEDTLVKPFEPDALLRTLRRHQLHPASPD